MSKCQNILFSNPNRFYFIWVDPIYLILWIESTLFTSLEFCFNDLQHLSKWQKVLYTGRASLYLQYLVLKSRAGRFQEQLEESKRSLSSALSINTVTIKILSIIYKITRNLSTSVSKIPQYECSNLNQQIGMLCILKTKINWQVNTEYKGKITRASTPNSWRAFGREPITP